MSSFEHDSDNDIPDDVFYKKKKKGISKIGISKKRKVSDLFNDNDDDDNTDAATNNDDNNADNTNNNTTTKTKSLSWKQGESEWVINKIISMSSTRIYYNDNALTTQGHKKLSNEFNTKYGSKRQGLCVPKRVNALYIKHRGQSDDQIAHQNLIRSNQEKAIQDNQLLIKKKNEQIKAYNRLTKKIIIDSKKLVNQLDNSDIPFDAEDMNACKTLFDRCSGILAKANDSAYQPLIDDIKNDMKILIDLQNKFVDACILQDWASKHFSSQLIEKIPTQGILNSNNVVMPKKFGDVTEARAKQGKDLKGKSKHILCRLKERSLTLAKNASEIINVTKQYIYKINEEKKNIKIRKTTKEVIKERSFTIQPIPNGPNTSCDSDIERKVEELQKLLLKRAKLNPPKDTRILLLHSLPISNLYGYQGMDYLMEGEQVIDENSMYSKLFHAEHGINISESSKVKSKGKNASLDNRTRIFLKEN